MTTRTLLSRCAAFCSRCSTTPDSQRQPESVRTSTTAPLSSSNTDTCLLPTGIAIASSAPQSSGSTPVKWSSTMPQIVNETTRSDDGSHAGVPKISRIA